jgi:alcohol-forming fatty acyl-CoA reductase
VTWGEYKEYIFEYLKNNPYHIQAFHPSIDFIPNETMFKARFFLKAELPVKIMEKLSKIPGIGTANLKKNVKKGKMMVSRAWETGILFDHFTTNSWIFETVEVENILKQMSDSEREEFYLDPKEINWRHTVKSYNHGIQKFCLKQESVAPDSKSTALIRKNDFEYFEDLRWAFFNGKPILSQDLN